MTKRQAEQQFLEQLKETNNVLTTEELIARVGRTTIRCAWVDYVDYLIKEHQVSEKVAYNWGQISL